MEVHKPKWLPLKRIIRNQKRASFKTWLVISILLIGITHFGVSPFFHIYQLDINSETQRYSLQSNLIQSQSEYFIVSALGKEAARKFVSLDTAQEQGEDFDSLMRYYRSVIRNFPNTEVYWEISVDSKILSESQIPTRLFREMRALTPIQKLNPDRILQLQSQFSSYFDGENFQIIPKISEFPPSIQNQVGILAKPLRNSILDFYLVEEIQSREIIGFNFKL